MTSAPFHHPHLPGSPAPFTFRGQHPRQFDRRSLAPVFGIGAAVAPPAQADSAPVPSPALLAARPARPVVHAAPQDHEDTEPAVRFTGSARTALRRLDLSCEDAADLVAHPDIVAPDDNQTPGREVHYSGDYGFICAVDEHVPERETTFVLGVFARNHSDGQAPESLREVTRSQPRYAGAGNATGTMPTSFDEVMARAEATDGWSVEPGRGKQPFFIVSDDGLHRHPVAGGAHDFRAVRNFVAQLRASGLDVRRPAGGKKR